MIEIVAKARLKVGLRFIQDDTSQLRPFHISPSAIVSVDCKVLWKILFIDYNG
jgi:hypothetical protein